MGAEGRVELVSVNVGLPREVAWRGEQVLTGIFKRPVAGVTRVVRHNLEGDAQADLSSHGGENKAVYGYPCEHYPHWRREYPELELSWGAFGENLTTRGLLEGDLRIGDRFRVGTAVLAVSQPRMPCFKLGIRFGRPDVVKRFVRSGLSGFYFSIVREGELAAGDELVRVASDPAAPTIAEITALHRQADPDRTLLARAVGLESLGREWRDDFRRKLDAAQ